VEADPIGIKKGKNHLYVYAVNTPVNNIDPLGLQGKGYKWGDFCTGALLRNRDGCKLTDSDIHVLCLQCCLEVVEGNPVPFPEKDTWVIICISACEGGLELIKKKKCCGNKSK